MQLTMFTRTKKYLLALDTNTLRVFLGIASFMTSISLYFPSETLNSLPSGKVIAKTFPSWVWATFFMVHALGIWWRQLDSRPRRYPAFAINALGLLTWFIFTGMKIQVVGSFNPFNAIELTLVLAAGFTLVRTGLNDDNRIP